MSKTPTQTSIAKKLGLARATVAEILGGSTAAERYNEETRRRVTEAAREMGYRPNRQARILSGAKSGLVGMIRSVSIQQRNAELVLYAGDALHGANYDVLSSDVFWRNDGLERACNALLDNRAEGVLFAHLSTGIVKFESVRRLIESGIPIVAIGGDPISGVCSVGTDYEAAGAQMAEHFAEQGYDDLVIVGHPGWIHPSDPCQPGPSAVRGFLARGHELGVRRVRVEKISREFHFTPSDAPPVESYGRTMMQRLIDQGPVDGLGVAFFGDAPALGAIQVCVERGVRVPQEVGIAGMDGWDIGKLVTPSLTTVMHPSQQVASRGVEVLLGLIRGEKVPEPLIVIPPRVVARGSTCRSGTTAKEAPSPYGALQD